jgi:large subunit ribosomal protein L29
MDIDKVRALTDTELVTELATAKRHLYDLRFQLATRQLTDYSQIPHTRRRIARILTVMTERQLSEATVPAFVPSGGEGNGRTARPVAAPLAEPAKQAEPAEEADEPPTRARPVRARAASPATAARRARTAGSTEGGATTARGKDEDKKKPASRRSSTGTARSKAK